MDPDDQVLAHTAADITGEPLLASRQAQLVWAVTNRLAAGSPFCACDLVALDWAARAVGLGSATGGGA